MAGFMVRHFPVEKFETVLREEKSRGYELHSWNIIDEERVGRVQFRELKVIAVFHSSPKDSSEKGKNVSSD